VFVPSKRVGPLDLFLLFFRSNGVILFFLSLSPSFESRFLRFKPDFFSTDVFRSFYLLPLLPPSPKINQFLSLRLTYLLPLFPRNSTSETCLFPFVWAFSLSVNVALDVELNLLPSFLLLSFRNHHLTPFFCNLF